jgi:peptidoglycan/LPS O-acetylase OafA/YrhL
VWSLAWESWFYLLLPILCILVRPGRFVAAIVLLAAIAPISRSYVNYPLVSDFVFGMLAAYFYSWHPTWRWAGSLWGSALLALLVIALWLAATHLPSWSWRIIAFPAFILVLYGADLFGLLVSSGWRLLGTVSYSVYLLHGSILFVLLGAVDSLCAIKSMSAWQYWLVICGCGAVVAMVSSISYRFVEYPFIQSRPVSRIAQIVRPCAWRQVQP